MIRHLVGGAFLGAVLVILGGIFLGANVHVTSSVNDERNGSGKFVVYTNEGEGGDMFTIVNTETGEARMFDAAGVAVTLPSPTNE